MTEPDWDDAEWCVPPGWTGLVNRCLVCNRVLPLDDKHFPDGRYQPCSDD
jgi:hypothetical protein